MARIKCGHCPRSHTSQKQRDLCAQRASGSAAGASETANRYTQNEGSYAGLAPAYQPGVAPQIQLSSSESAVDSSIARAQEPDGPDGYLAAASHLLEREVSSIQALTDDEFRSLSMRSSPSQHETNREFSRDKHGTRIMAVKGKWEAPGDSTAPSRSMWAPHQKTKTRWTNNLV